MTTLLSIWVQFLWVIVMRWNTLMLEVLEMVLSSLWCKTFGWKGGMNRTLWSGSLSVHLSWILSHFNHMDCWAISRTSYSAIQLEALGFWSFLVNSFSRYMHNLLIVFLGDSWLECLGRSHFYRFTFWSIHMLFTKFVLDFRWLCETKLPFVTQIERCVTLLNWNTSILRYPLKYLLELHVFFL